MPEHLLNAAASSQIYLCASEELVNGASAVPFEVRYYRQSCAAFAIRYAGKAHAYLNRCSHVPMEMDFQPNQFFDHSGQWLICATHGALYAPDSGRCSLGPCRGGLVKIDVTEADGKVHWHTSDKFQPEYSV